MLPNDTISSLISLAGPIIAAAGLISGVWWRMESKVDTVRNDAEEHVRKARDETHALEKELGAFKLEVTRDYASWDTVKAIEARLTARMDSLSAEVSKMPEAIVDRLLKYTSLNLAAK